MRKMIETFLEARFSRNNLIWLDFRSANKIPLKNFTELTRKSAFNKIISVWKKGR